MSTSGAASADRTATAHMTAAAITTLFSAPVTVVPAPGAGLGVVLLGGSAQYVPGATGSFSNNGLPALYYADASSAAHQASTDVANLAALSAFPPTNQIGLLTPGVLNVLGNFTPNAVPFLAADIANKPLVFASSGADLDPISGATAGTVNAGGAAYVAGDTGTFSQDFYGGGATYVITTVAAGAVTGFTITAPGTGYSTVADVVTSTNGGAQPGIGVGFKANITAIGAVLADLYVTVAYDIVAVH